MGVYGRAAVLFAVGISGCGAAAATDGDKASGATMDTATGGADGSTTAIDPCAAVECEPWEVCEAGRCVLAPGQCTVHDDCEAGLVCDDHVCASPCEVLDCPVEATCQQDDGMAWCVCGGGLFANGGACVDRILFALPMDNPDGSLISGVIGFDHDPAPGTSDLDCVSYAGDPFPACYDDHTGSDFILAGGFTRMDNGSAAVFAAADGEVVEVHDGEYDRCAVNLTTQQVECEDGGPVTPANRITVEHADGSRTEYLHLMKNSITVEIGDRVTCGQPMALVGSSGNSSMPHLHFTVIDPDGFRIDPFAGRFSSSESHWVDQDGPHDLPAPTCQ